MELERGTAAYKAYEAGKNAYAQGFGADRNPYLTSKQIALSNWWLKGFNELKELMSKKKPLNGEG